MQLTKPEPLAACTKGADPGEDKSVSDQLDVTITSHCKISRAHCWRMKAAVRPDPFGPA